MAKEQKLFFGSFHRISDNIKKKQKKKGSKKPNREGEKIIRKKFT